LRLEQAFQQRALPTNIIQLLEGRLILQNIKVDIILSTGAEFDHRAFVFQHTQELRIWSGNLCLQGLRLNPSFLFFAQVFLCFEELLVGWYKPAPFDSTLEEFNFF
jgi:hypothetical protein